MVVRSAKADYADLLATLEDVLLERGRDDLVDYLKRSRPLWVPEVGDKIRLLYPWTFRLIHEERNHRLIALVDRQNDKEPWAGKEYPLAGHHPRQVTLAAGTLLSVARVYVRQGASDFNSLSFIIKEHPTMKGHRFWARLSDTRSIVFDGVEAS